MYAAIGLCFSAKSQTTFTTIAPGHYKNASMNSYGDYRRVLILLHEMYNGTTLLGINYAIGTITALRGSVASGNRLNVININTSSAYNETLGTCISSNQNSTPSWKLKTCTYNGKKYLAVDIPYVPAYHEHGYKFTGWATSTGESLLSVPYYDVQNNLALNQTILTNIADYTSSMYETHEVGKMNITGNVCIGTEDDRGYKLAVNGTIRAKEIKVEANPWPDYVFENSYTPATLASIEQYIKLNKHLPEMPSATEIEQNGVNLGEMNAMPLKKIEELTLHLIEHNKKLEQQSKQIDILNDKNGISAK